MCEAVNERRLCNDLTPAADLFDADVAGSIQQLPTSTCRKVRGEKRHKPQDSDECSEIEREDGNPGDLQDLIMQSPIGHTFMLIFNLAAD